MNNIDIIRLAEQCSSDMDGQIGGWPHEWLEDEQVELGPAEEVEFNAQLSIGQCDLCNTWLCTYDLCDGICGDCVEEDGEQ